MHYTPQVDDYVRWNRPGISGHIDEGWVYFKCDESISIEVGVKDKPHLQEDPIIGIENDFKWVAKKDLEGFGHALIQLLNDAFGDQSTLKLYAKISYPTTNGKTICRIDIDPLPRIRNGELWVKTKTLGTEEFFYRVSDTTTHASVKSANRYIRHHFEGFSGENNQS